MFAHTLQDAGSQTVGMTNKHPKCPTVTNMWNLKNGPTESWHDLSGGALAILCRLLPNLTPSSCGGVFSFAEIGLLRISGSWHGVNDARLEMKEAAN